jgi:hypothetical protein
MKFPNDDNGATLREMHEAGIDLSQPLNVDFFLIFKTKKDAEAMIEALAASGETVETMLEQNEIHDDWDLCCTINMTPTHAAITLRELQFEKLAEKHNGLGDGWGVTDEED